MNDARTSRARDYHEATKNWPGDDLVRRIDPSIIPRLFKSYPDLPALPLPEPRRSGSGRAGAALDLASLAAVLHYAAGIMRRTTISGRELVFRAASCTGAAYHIELYMVMGDLMDLPAGVYHYDVQHEALRRLREGDYRRGVLEALCSSVNGRAREAYIVATSTFWRNAWRYEERSYRHAFWDGGTVLANLLAVSDAHDLQPLTRLAFIDATINELIGVDSQREAAVYVVGLGGLTEVAEARKEGTLPRIQAAPISRVEIEYPLIYETHASTAFSRCDEVLGWTRGGVAAPPVKQALATYAGIESLIEGRGSTRHFSRREIKADVLHEILPHAFGAVDSDLPGQGLALTEARLIVNAVEGLDAGKYRYVTASGELELIERGDFRVEAAHLALDQEAAGAAAVNVYFLADLDAVLGGLGARGYRACQLEGGVRGGRVYLAAHAHGLKVSGLTFYDDEVREFFNLSDSGMEVMFLAVAG